jgi:hypothetical protein
MDEVERLIKAFGSHGKRNQSVWKLNVLLDLGLLDDARVVQFLVAVVADPDEPAHVRADALRRLREPSLSPCERVRAACAGLDALTPASDSELRLHAAVILGDFIEVEGVLEALGALAADLSEPMELRYNAFTSLQRAGPTSECVTILRALSDDEALGRSACALLASWGAAD